jgi:hypothetical protein
MDQTIKPETPLSEAGFLDAAAVKTLAGQWITSVEQFLLRAATAEGRAQLASLIGGGEERIEARRQALLGRLPEEARGALKSPPPPGPRPGMGLRLSEEDKKRKAV